MPVVETTVIEGYDAATKARLMTGMARVVRSVMAAPPDGIITVLREVQPSAYMRGGVSRVPGPPLPPASDTVRAFHAALDRGDREALAGLVTGALAETAMETLLAGVIPGAVRERHDEALTDEAVLVFVEGTAGGVRFLERYTVTGARVADRSVWMAGS